MALNIALPLSGVPELIQRCGSIFPNLSSSPLEAKLQLLVEPYDSESAGSSDSDDNKDQNSPIENEKEKLVKESSKSLPASPIPSPLPSPKKQSIESLPSKSPSPVKPLRYPKKIEYRGRNVLDLASNLTDKKWNLQYAVLPNRNIDMFMANRSQYHRVNGTHIHEYDLEMCNECNFEYPTAPGANIIKKM